MCQIGDKLRLRFEATTREWKKYEERFSEHGFKRT